MRDAVGSTWIFSLVITFTLIFSGFLVLALSYSKAYKIKNEITSIIEKYEGITSKAYNNDGSIRKGSIGIINDYLINSAYLSKGTCDVGDYASNDLDNTTNLTLIDNTNQNDRYYYCIRPVKNKCHTVFEITVFYDFNLPILGALHKYSITGQTQGIYQAFINDKLQSCK